MVYAGGLYFCANIGIGIMGCVSRGQIRNKYSITTGDCADSCSDCLLHSFCTCCALSQEWRELKFRADQPTTITVPGGAIVGTAVQGPAVVVMTSPVYVSREAHAARVSRERQQRLPRFGHRVGVAHLPFAGALFVCATVRFRLSPWLTASSPRRPTCSSRSRSSSR